MSARIRLSTRRRALTESVAPRPARAGMTLIEIMVAMLILVGVLFALGGFTARFAQASGQARLTITANELAATRLDAIRSQPSYAAINGLIGGRAVKSDFATYAESTKVTRIGGGVTDSVDYKLVTVVVRHPSMRRPVTKTTAIAAF